MVVFATGLFYPAYSQEVRDKTLDIQCRPRWDRFVVDENTTNWDKDSVTCYDKYGNEVDFSSIYGSPKMYGEFEGDVQKNIDDPSKLYGKYDPSQPGVKVASAPQPKVAKPKPKAQPKVEAKRPPEPVKPKLVPVAPAPKPEPQPKPTPVPALQPATQPIEKPKVEPVPAPKPVMKPAVPDKNAQNIAKTLNSTVDVDSYCTSINPPVKGPLPKGIVLMPGRTDMMSCVKN